jgi:hypothetical protein
MAKSRTASLITRMVIMLIVIGVILGGIFGFQMFKGKMIAQFLASRANPVDEEDVKAPFAGRLGIRQVDLGQYLSAGTTIVTLQSLDPIYVDFTCRSRRWRSSRSARR